MTHAKSAMHIKQLRLAYLVLIIRLAVMTTSLLFTGQCNRLDAIQCKKKHCNVR